ncbi:hypothetical protein DEU56DRAFT_953870 [Suillus clintonianus]|uniref:uncharacterized protein n=1 Tax=Suillus clintonianus TaxID=1904413 RepID=UPI001B869441|nr:uncharacterized protein DEU56DRAFT_953870 [Suillus clintonianus]KAG2131337.1 hypothetical protein DEU56DRAFT_953870 [Suillus clintonianus]
MDYDTQKKLQQLYLFLSNLPDTIPYADAGQTQYGFSLDDDRIEDMGPIGALNCALECVMGQCHNGPISFKERGPGLEAVVDILEAHLIEHHESPETILLVKWIDDLTTAAEAAFMSAGIMLPLWTMAAKPTAEVTKNGKKAAYFDLPETDNLRASGAKSHPLLLEGTRRCYKVPEGECIGSKHCGTTWNMPRARDRIMAHLSKCTHIDESIQERALKTLAASSKGPKLRIPNPEPSQAADSEEPDDSGSKTKPSRPSTKPLQSFVRKGREENGDHAVMKFIVCCGVPPTIVDSLEWKELISVLNSNYHSPSSTTLTRNLIIKEAAKIEPLQ